MPITGATECVSCGDDPDSFGTARADRDGPDSHAARLVFLAVLFAVKFAVG